MNKQDITILERVNEIEKSLQVLKLDYFFSLPRRGRNKSRIYEDKDILSELRKTRKKFWNEKYSKVV